MTDEMWENVAKAKGFSSMRTMLQEKYVDEHLNLQEIADWFGCSVGTIRKFLDKYKIPKRLRRVDLSHIPPLVVVEMTITELMAKYHISKGTAWRLKNQKI